MTGMQPELWVDRGASAVEFYRTAFGATGRRRNPNAIGGATGRTLFVVDDPDSMFERAIAAGATATSPPGDEHGWRLARLIDPFGHEWAIGHPLGIWPPPG